MYYKAFVQCGHNQKITYYTHNDIFSGDFNLQCNLKTKGIKVMNFNVIYRYK